MSSDTESKPRVGVNVPLTWIDNERGYRCSYCCLWVCIPQKPIAVCPRCAPIPVDEAAGVLLADHGVDENDSQQALDALGPLLDALLAAHVGAHR